MALALTAMLHTGVFGVTGTGKSELVKQSIAAAPRVVVVDVNDEWSVSSTRRKGPLREAITPEELTEHPGMLLKPKLSLALVGLDPFKPRRTADAVKLIARLQQTIAAESGRPPPPLLLILDECGRYAPLCRDVISGLSEVGGQHLRVTVWCIAQRPAMVPKTVRANLKRFAIFHVEEPSDLEALEERTHSPGLSQQVLALPATYDPKHNGPHYVLWPTGGAPQAVHSNLPPASPPASPAVPPITPTAPKVEAAS